MNNKIVGFTISKNRVDHRDYDIMESGLLLKSFKRCGYNVYLWGIGDLEKCFINENIISLSFPLHDKLDDRNVLISFTNNEIIVENDWLGSIPVFYNKTLDIVSTLISKTYNNKKFSIDAEGLYGYLDFGFSIFEKTPIKDVNLLRYFSRLILGKEIKAIYKEDIYLNKIYLNNKESSPALVVKTVKNYINSATDKISGNIIIPTSGGYDSRFLNALVGDRKRIRSFTYGLTSLGTEKSSEVVKARYITKKLGIWWKEIKLGNFLLYYEKWYKIFGMSSHLHGMYHLEFYKKIKKFLRNDFNYTVLNGIVGDAWSGNIKFVRVRKYSEIWKIGITHGLRINPMVLKKLPDLEKYRTFYTVNRKFISNPLTQVVLMIRIKLILLSYLMSVPEYLKLPSWSPFLSFDVVSKMLSIDTKLRKNRTWQEDFFRDKDIFPEEKGLDYTNTNTLDYGAVCRFKIPNINLFSLFKYFKLDYLARVYFGYLILTYFKVKNYIWSFNELCVLKSFEIGIAKAEK